MIVEPLFFRDLAYVFVAAVVGAAIARAARQPLILGYVLGGMLIGPFTPGPAGRETISPCLLASSQAPGPTAGAAKIKLMS